MGTQHILFCLVLLLNFLCGCGGIRHIQKNAAEVVWKQHEAKLHDIPIIVGGQPEPESSAPTDAEHIGLSYVVDTEKTQACTFYKEEMEQNGWRLLSVFDGEESLLIFEKPSKLATISLRPGKGETLKVVIFLSLRE